MKFIYKYQTIGPNGYAWAQKGFSTQKELMKYLVSNKDEIFAQKKSIIKHAEGCLSATLPAEEELIDYKSKAINMVYENDKEAGILKRTIVANTYWWMDSHADVHIGRGDAGEEGKAVFTDSIKGRTNKVYPIDQHNMSLDGKMGKTLELYEAPISWRALGVGKTGMTEALFAVAQIEKERNPARYRDYSNDEIDQHSVGMRYMKMSLAVNDPDEYPNEYKEWEKFIGKIGNRKAVEAQGYFFPIYEAQLFEYSAVIAGSNELTPTLGAQPPSGTGKSSPSSDTKKKQRLEALKQLSQQLKIN